MRRKPGTPYPKDFSPELNDEDAKEFANVDHESTLRLYRDKALAGGWLYSNWTSAYRNYLRGANKYGGVVYRGRREFDPRWKDVLAEARKAGFREPEENETPGSYKSAFDFWKTQPRSNVIDFGKVLKRV
jgi:hypothetical protein